MESSEICFFSSKTFLKHRNHFSNFSLLGKIPITKDSLMGIEKLIEMGDSSIFNSLLGMLFGPQDLPFLRV